jgi:hypothetical protein
LKRAKSSRSKTGNEEPQLTATAQRVQRASIEVRHAGLTFNHKHQIFIAKLKRGEIWALNQLSLAAKTAVTPLLEMWPPNPGGKTLAQHTTDLMQMLASEWTGLPCYLDTKFLGSGAPSAPAAQTVFAIARTSNVVAVPVTSPFFGPPFQQVIRNTIATDNRGVMLRLPMLFFNDQPNVQNYLNGLLTILDVQRNQVDILIDLEYLPNAVAVTQTGLFCLNSLPWIADWRTVTLGSGCFPDSISDQPVGQWIPFSRTDWIGWQAALDQRRNAHQRLPSYADYGVRCGGEPKVIPNAPAPNLRYSDELTIWVRKGQKAPGAMRVICGDLVNQIFFKGAQFSVGDAAIAQKATMTDSSNGTPEQWIRWCTNHHLELTFSQIQNLP